MHLDTPKQLPQTVIAKPKDWAGSWFPIMERLGETTDFYVAKLDRNGAIHWQRAHHTDFDGVSGMTYFLHGPHAKPPESMKLRDPKPPGLLRTFYTIWKHARLVQKQKTIWKHYEPTRVGYSPGISWSTFDAQTTASFKEGAQKLGVSLNALLLWALDRAVRTQLVNGGTTRWAIPVNMRGALNIPEDAPNQFSFIHVVCNPETSPLELQSLIRASLKEGCHWANWALMHIGKHIGLEKAEAHFIERYKDPKPATGAFSSLGEWDSSLIAPDESWIVCATTSKLNPIAVCPIIVNQKLALTLQVHPCLSPTLESIQELKDLLLGELRMILGVEGQPTFSAVANVDTLTYTRVQVDH